MSWTQLLFDLIDTRSFSNMWYWIALAVTWSSASHWVLGVPFDMVLRARRQGGQAEQDLEDMVRVNVNRLLHIARDAGVILMAIGTCFLTVLLLLGFVYRVEICQAVVLMALPLSLVMLMSIRTAARIERMAPFGEELRHILTRHRLKVQVVGMISIFIAAFWGMLQNFNVFFPV